MKYIQSTLIARLPAHAEDKDLALDWLKRVFVAGVRSYDGQMKLVR